LWSEDGPDWEEVAAAAVGRGAAAAEAAASSARCTVFQRTLSAPPVMASASRSAQSASRSPVTPCATTASAVADEKPTSVRKAAQAWGAQLAGGPDLVIIVESASAAGRAASAAPASAARERSVMVARGAAMVDLPVKGVGTGTIGVSLGVVVVRRCARATADWYWMPEEKALC